MQQSRIDDALHFGVLLSLLVRWAVSRFPYSGAGKPPMYGDYEAQRHWMEITVNLPMQEWYKNTTLNDLQYWGLDYPPLTAYQSMLFGYIAKWFDPDWVSLNSSRGYESYDHKIFMRSTVLAADVLAFYIPVILYWSIIIRPAKLRDKSIAASLTLLYPGLILIDHGHFQYNCVSLGFTIWAIVLMMWEYDLAGALFFTLAIHYKQMSLYHALPFFCYLLGSCFQQQLSTGLAKFLKLSIVVILTSAICWGPFLSTSETLFQVISRLFPFDRGLFEDKVANIWCALSIVIKFKQLLSTSSLAAVSAISTLLAVFPSSLHLFYCPKMHTLRLALANSSLLFFLLSYQVHEKSILLAAIPILLMLEDHPLACTWFVCISTFSLVPLLAKDGLIIPFFSLVILFLAGVLRAYGGLGMSFKNKQTRLKTIAFWLSLLGCFCLIIAMYTVKAPAQYPHLHILINCIYSCAHLVGFTVYFHHCQFTELPWILFKPKTKYL